VWSISQGALHAATHGALCPHPPAPGAPAAPRVGALTPQARTRHPSQGCLPLRGWARGKTRRGTGGTPGTQGGGAPRGGGQGRPGTTGRRQWGLGRTRLASFMTTTEAREQGKYWEDGEGEGEEVGGGGGASEGGQQVSSASSRGLAWEERGASSEARARRDLDPCAHRTDLLCGH